MNTPKLISALVETCKALGAKRIEIDVHSEPNVSPVHLHVCGGTDEATRALAKAFGVTLDRRTNDVECWLAGNGYQGEAFVVVSGPMVPVANEIDGDRVESSLADAREAVAS